MPLAPRASAARPGRGRARRARRGRRRGRSRRAGGRRARRRRIEVSPVPIAIEQPDPRGVSCTTRAPGCGSASWSTAKPGRPRRTPSPGRRRRRARPPPRAGSPSSASHLLPRAGRRRSAGRPAPARGSPRPSSSPRGRPSRSAEPDVAERHRRARAVRGEGQPLGRLDHRERAVVAHQAAVGVRDRVEPEHAAGPQVDLDRRGRRGPSALAPPARRSARARSMRPRRPRAAPGRPGRPRSPQPRARCSRSLSKPSSQNSR